MSQSERLRVFVTRRMPGQALERLSQHVEVDLWAEDSAPPQDQLIARTAAADGLLCTLSDRIDQELIDACPRLRAVATCSVGYDHVDLKALTARGIQLGYTPGVLTAATADLAMALMLSAGRRITEADRFVRDGSWAKSIGWNPSMLLGVDFANATLGIAGFGEIGQAVAHRAQAFGMKVLAWSRSGRTGDGIEAVSFEEMIKRSDIISLHVPMTAETRGLFNADMIAAMKPGSMLINTARGGIVDEQALADALHTGHIAAAGFDVFAVEPIPGDNPLLSAPNMVVAPHIGSATLATRSRMAEMTVDNILAGFARKSMPNSPNKAQLEGRL